MTPNLSGYHLHGAAVVGVSTGDWETILQKALGEEKSAVKERNTDAREHSRSKSVASLLVPQPLSADRAVPDLCPALRADEVALGALEDGRASKEEHESVGRQSKYFFCTAGSQSPRRGEAYWALEVVPQLVHRDGVLEVRMVLLLRLLLRLHRSRLSLPPQATIRTSL